MATPSASTSAVASASPSRLSAEQTSGVSPIELIVAFGALVGIFVVAILIGWMLSAVNRPNQEAHPYTSYTAGTEKGLFQPSAAGYGTMGVKRRQSPPTGAPAQLPSLGADNYGSATSLLDNAAGMGRASHSSSDVVLPMADGGGAGGDGGAGFRTVGSRGPGHTRGASSGVAMPGPVASRRSNAGVHPPTVINMDQPMAAGAPDGGGFRPGMVVGAAALNGHPPDHRASSNGYANRLGVGQLPMRGPERGAAPRLDPQQQQQRRRSRYASRTASRIDSVGPGVMRKSLFLGPQGAYAGGGEGGGGLSPGGAGFSSTRRASKLSVASRQSRRVSRRPTFDEEPGAGAANSNDSLSPLRRVDSVGRGDWRRRSRYESGVGGYQTTSPSSGAAPWRRGSRYDAAAAAAAGGGGAANAERAMLRGAAADNFGAGRKLSNAGASAAARRGGGPAAVRGGGGDGGSATTTPRSQASALPSPSSESDSLYGASTLPYASASASASAAPPLHPGSVADPLGGARGTPPQLSLSIGETLPRGALGGGGGGPAGGAAGAGGAGWSFRSPQAGVGTASRVGVGAGVGMGLSRQVL